MTVQLDRPANDGFVFEDNDFRMLATLAKREFGLNLAESKKPLVHSRLARRLKAANLKRFSEYLSLVSEPANREERRALISALTTNVTSFFREKHHFELFEQRCLKPRKQAVEGGARFRVWSAGCSIGPEPYSLAMTILNTWPDAGHRDVRILATDIDAEVVETAKAGVYYDQDAAYLSTAPATRFCDARSDGGHRMKDEVKALITFAELNLIAEWPFRGPFDAIFCRNVAIYFDHPTQQRLWHRFSTFLADGGMLFIGHSERVSGPAEAALIPAGVTSYCKPGKPDTSHLSRTKQ